jgi:hypothetical protein
MVLFGAQAAGAVLWGVVAATAGLVPAFLISAAIMAAGAATIWFWPFHQIADMDRSLVCWPEPQLVISADRGNGLVLVRTAYTVATERRQQFLEAMGRLRQSRLRTGATDWGLYEDGENPGLFIEVFSVASWDEHLRQHRERQTGTDLEYHDAAAALSDPPAQTSHYLAVDVNE